jgi:hypothetical protein
VVKQFESALLAAGGAGVRGAVQSAITIVLALGLVLLAPGQCPPGLAQNESVFNPWPIFPNRPKRVLQFPKDYSLGEIMITSAAASERVRGAKVLRGAARGTVTVPAGKIVALNVTHRFLQNPGIIQTIDPDGLDSLKINATSMDESEDGLCDRALKFVRHLSGLTELCLDRSDSTDLGLAHAAELPNLHKFSAFSTQMNGSCLKSICTLKKLRVLRIAHNILKEENLIFLSALPELECLSVARTGLSDAGMKYLSKCGKLRILDLSENPGIGDQSIKHLLPLKNLAYLCLKGTQISPEGIKQLKPLALKDIVLPAESYKKNDLDSIGRTLSGVVLEVRGKVAVDGETRDLYAPLP